MTNKKLLLGDQAIAQGALDAGLSGVYAYPGTPSTEITEYIQLSPQGRSGDVYCRWCTNEKTAMEAALGMSYAGKRALVCMKHVGMNVCADAFINSAVTGVNGGLVVLAADDPSMHSSQNEQDSRFYGKFAMIPILEPSSQQEAYDMMAYAFDLSEQLHEPVLMRVVTRLAHSRAVVGTAAVREQNPLNAPARSQNWVLLPAIARRRNKELIALQPDMNRHAANDGYNRYAEGTDRQLGIIACGIGYNYYMENYPQGAPHTVLKISQYPLPTDDIRRLADTCQSILVIEDGQPFVEEQLRGILPSKCKIKGRLTGELPRDGELTPDNVKAALGFASSQQNAPSDLVVARPPALCQGCGHRSVYEALNRIVEKLPEARVFGDIGCYTLGALPPYKAINSCVDMGASITMAKGAADAGVFPAIAVIGDSTFTHSGMTGLLDAVNCNSPITVIISDNLTTAMTGGQDSAGTNKFEAICLGLGVDKEHLHVVNPLPQNMDEITRIMEREFNYKGLSVIIPRRECIQTLSRKAKQKNNK
ncbi:MAG: indolepyruvate ferredoxin oxidoreductase subunit alpha [Paludibacteraceae bacterium]|nr:indolepyruvate ferredoxin oxidoreductase subunit alpha [Paludibacteraceae bacterium]